MSGLVGTGSLVRLALRRDRVILAVWILIFVAIAAGSASATVGLYDTVQARMAAASSINNTPSLVALYGLIYDESSLGALSLIKLGAFGGALVSVLAILIVIRHTRAEEETGRLELVGSAVVGRHAALAAALIVTVGAILALGLLTTLGLVGAGLPAAGSLAFGLAWASIGIAFAAVAAVAAQVTESARAAIGLAVAFLGVVYVLRAVGDTAGDGAAAWVRWLSPIGWGQQVRPYQGDRWWVLAIPAVFFLLVAAAAYALVERRDHGAGLLPQRPGPATATATLRGPLGLAWRLHRGALVGWAAGFVLLGLVFGNIASNIGNFLGSPAARDLIQKLGGVKSLTDAFMSTELGIVGVIASVYGVQVVMRLRSEESELRSEPVLATTVGRISWAWSHITVALLGTAALLVCAGLGGGLTYAAQTGNTGDFWRVLAAAVVRVPAAWVMAGIVVTAFGLAPRAVVAGWVALVAFLLLGELGPLFGLNQWVMDLSPYAHVPRLPGANFTALPLIGLVVVAAAFTAAGLAGFRRRDIPVT
jgi:polyether ionophore transport system permease protein